MIERALRLGDGVVKQTATALCLVALSFASAEPVGGQTVDGDLEAAVARAAASITVADLQTRLVILAHDSMRGRNTPSPELTKTASYVATQFRAFGLEPGVGDGYLQVYPLNVLRAGPAEAQALRLEGPDGSVELSHGDQFFPYPDVESAEASGTLVRIDSPEARVDARGQIAVIHVTEANIRAVFRGGYRSAVRSAEPAATLVVLELPASMFAAVRQALTGERVSLAEARGAERPTILVIRSALPPSLAEAISAGGALDGWSAEVRASSESQSVEAPNSVGVLRGSDPLLRDEYVIFSAHMDHVGVGQAFGGDSIYNGADDNASGTVTVLELAEAFASLERRPRRSIVFLTVSGEEKGLLGSRWYVENPPFPIVRTVANINLDMVGRNWRDTIVVIGREESSLGMVLEKISSERPELELAVIDDPWPEQRFYTRSDHFNFARRGVPILFFFSGTHADYHRPSDEADKIDYEKISRLGRLVFYLGLEVANADEPPQWDPAAYERVVEGAGG